MVTKSRWPSFLVVTILVLVGLAAVASPAHAQYGEGQCGPGEMGQLPGSNSGVVVCDPQDRWEWTIGEIDSCGGAAVWDPQFYHLNETEMLFGVPPWFTVDGPMIFRVLVTIRWGSLHGGQEVEDFNYIVESFDSAGNRIDFVQTNTRFNPGYVNDYGYHLQIYHDDLQGVQNGYFRLIILEDANDRGWGSIGALGATFRVSQPVILPDGFQIPDPCPFPGPPRPTDTPTPSPEPTSTGTLTPSPTATASTTPTPSRTPSITPTPSPGPSATPSRTPPPTLTPWSVPTAGVTTTPQAQPTATPYRITTATSIPTATALPIPTFMSGAFPTLTVPDMPNPSYETFELPSLEIPSITYPTLIATTALTQSLTPNATISATNGTRTAVFSETEAIISSWVTGTVLLDGGVLSGTSAMSAAVTIAQGVTTPIVYTRALQVYMPNLWPYVFIILLLLGWIVLNLLARYALALLGVLYRLVDTIIRWFIPGLG